MDIWHYLNIILKFNKRRNISPKKKRHDSYIFLRAWNIQQNSYSVLHS